MATHVIKQGQLGPPLIANLTADGSPQNITGATVTFYMKDTRTGLLKINGSSVSVLDAVNGQVKYQWSGTDTDTPGFYKAEFQVAGLSPTPVRFPSEADDEYLYVSIPPKVA